MAVATVQSRDRRVPGAGIDAHFGYDLAAGDFDGNGTDDLAIGVPYSGKAPDEGSVVVLYSAAGSVQLVPPARRDTRFGGALAALPVRGERYDDLLVGAPGVGENATPSDDIGALEHCGGGPVHLGSLSPLLTHQDPRAASGCEHLPIGIAGARIAGWYAARQMLRCGPASMLGG